MLSIIIPIYNRLALTKACLQALARQTVPADQIIVVDDGSTDGTSEMINAEFPDVVVLRGDGNLWWTRATNLGLQFALERGATHILTLNDDTLPEPAFLENMLAAARRDPRALIGAYAVDAVTRKPVFAGSRVKWMTACFENLPIAPSNSQDHWIEVTHFPGRGLLIPAEVFRRIGIFDAAHFPHYLADYDFTCRAYRAGYRIFCSPAAVLGIYPEASGDAENRRRKSFRKFYRHLFHIKGGANLNTFVWFALRNCPKPLLPVCLALGLARRVFGYPLDWIKEICSTGCHTDADYRRA